uniref:Uncharacterized protein n=1 Tax=Tanacetum cinerariifolium TaxID=118510 RepID=A0A699RGC2_TANCI|nr:hypothetical protein [Tanacetum cinerariifolium]
MIRPLAAMPAQYAHFLIALRQPPNNLIQRRQHAKQHQANGVPGVLSMKVIIEPGAGPGAEADGSQHLKGDTRILGKRAQAVGGGRRVGALGRQRVGSHESKRKSGPISYA